MALRLPRGTMRAVALGVAVLALAQCNPIPPPPAPLVVPRPGGTADNPVIYGAFAYPVGKGTTAVELDSPMRTRAGTEYFAMEANFRIDGPTELVLTWVEDKGESVPVTRVAGPCGAAAGAAQRGYMATRAYDDTGRATTGSYDPSIDTRLDGGEPMFWITCDPDWPGASSHPQLADIHYRNAAILIPANTLGEGGTLIAQARHLYNHLSSDETSLPVRRSRILIGVAGDSVAWGQGNREETKYYRRFRAEVEQTLGLAQLRVEAHSGAEINLSNTRKTIERANRCWVDGTVPGEVQRSRPTIQCQIRTLSRLVCRTDPDLLGHVAVPAFLCLGDKISDDVDTAELVNLVFDAGPRFDFLLFAGCYNDTGAFGVHLGNDNISTTVDVLNRATEQCDLTNGVGDIRLVLSNAAIAVMGYHITMSALSSFANTGCPYAPGGLTWDVANALPVAMTLGLQGVSVNEIVDRAGIFRSQSNIVLAETTALLDTQTGGRGRVVFIDMSDVFGPENAALATDPLVFGVNCESEHYLGPEDAVAEPREPACFDRFGAEGTHPNLTKEQACIRASAYHPNEAAQPLMAARIVDALTEAGAYPP